MAPYKGSGKSNPKVKKKRELLAEAEKRLPKNAPVGGATSIRERLDGGKAL